MLQTVTLQPTSAPNVDACISREGKAVSLYCWMIMIRSRNLINLYISPRGFTHFIDYNKGAISNTCELFFKKMAHFGQ